MADTGAQPADGGTAAGSSPSPVRILQLTDLHLYGDPDGRLLGQNTRDTLESVLALAQRRHWPPHALLLTGDLVHDERVEGYRFLRERIARLGLPCYCLPGNHDRIDLLAGFLDADAVSAFRLIRLGAWDLVLLDSTIPGEEGGHLPPILMAELDRHARANPRRHLLIFAHHHPAPVGSRWIDTMAIDNGADLLAVAAAHENIRAVVCGHVHQAFEAIGAGISWISTPSTCLQFLPGSEEFALDDLTPGYRWLELYADGRLETAVVRTAAYPEPLRRSTSGY